MFYKWSLLKIGFVAGLLFVAAAIELIVHGDVDLPLSQASCPAATLGSHWSNIYVAGAQQKRSWTGHMFPYVGTTEPALYMPIYRRCTPSVMGKFTL